MNIQKAKFPLSAREIRRCDFFWIKHLVRR